MTTPPRFYSVTPTTRPAPPQGAVMVPVDPELLALGEFTKEPLHVRLEGDAVRGYSLAFQRPTHAAPSEPVAWVPRDKNGVLYIEHASVVEHEVIAECASLSEFPSFAELAPFTVVPLDTRPAPREGVTEAMALAAAKESARISGAPWSGEDIAEFWPDLKDEWIAVVTAALAVSP